MGEAGAGLSYPDSPSDELTAFLKARVSAHEPVTGHVQWYVDDLCIDCDAEEFWKVVGQALAETFSGDAVAPDVPGFTVPRK